MNTSIKIQEYNESIESNKKPTEKPDTPQDIGIQRGVNIK